MRQKYISKKFKPGSMDLIATISSILNEYIRDGYAITVRSLYYQLVARGYIPNTEKSYKTITNLVSDARLAGLLDWDVIEDRMRAFVSRPHWTSGNEILEGVAQQFYMDHWSNQEARVYCIIEKDALSGVISGTCRAWDVPMLAARGYPSSSVVRDFVKHTLIPNSDQRIILLHMGDHDPSGIDMSRDLEERIEMFSEGMFSLEFHRLALNMDQVEEHQPPPNPAKMTDSRFAGYSDLYGDESWELDALNPRVLNNLLSVNIQRFVDQSLWGEKDKEIEDVKKRLKEIAETF